MKFRKSKLSLKMTNLLLQIDDVWSGIGNTNNTKTIAETLKEAIYSEMGESSLGRMKAGNLNASLEAVKLMVGAHEMFNDTPYYQEVQVDTRTI